MNFVDIDRSPATIIQNVAPGPPMVMARHAGDVPETDRAGDGGGERLKMRDLADLVGSV